jgi:hypothetical protein
MKNIVKTFAILFLSVTYSCNTQQLVESPALRSVPENIRMLRIL